MKNSVCMIVPSFSAKGGIASVVSRYPKSKLVIDYKMSFIETYCDGSNVQKIKKAFIADSQFLILIHDNKPSLVHIHMSFGGSFYRACFFIYVSYIHKIPILIQIHGSEINKFYFKSSSIKKFFVKSTLEKCRELIVLSDEWVPVFHQIFPHKKIEVVQNYSVLQDSQVNIQSHSVLFLGFLTKLKGCYDIPEIARKVCKKFPHTKFMLGGTGDQEALQDLVADKGIDKNIEFLGWVKGDEKDRLLRSSRIFFLPSYTEAMPMSILEAMGYGLPIIATNVGGIPQLVKDGINGFLFSPGDIEGMANAIIRLLNDSELCKKMGEESKKIVKENFSFNSHLNHIERIYNNILCEE